MIKDKLENANLYYSVSENLKHGFEWLRSNDLLSLKDGKYVIDGDKIYANVQSYNTKDDAPYEVHRKYIDIQYMIKGKEKIGLTNKSDCITVEEYNNENDIEFMNTNSDKFQTLETGEFLVFFPHDAHQPALDLEEKFFVKKVIVKVAI